MREKSEVFKIFKKFLNLLENQSGRSIKIFRSDEEKNITTLNSTSSVKKRESNIKQLSAIILTKWSLRKKEQNSYGDSKIDVAGEALAKSFLGRSSVDCSYLLNMCPTKAVQNMMPIEAWNGKKPSKHFRVFGSIYYVHIPT
ncbi:UNVERIFIED_CONTAM: hypothetical protein Sangu_2495900 [Sesamum angustifolium]|uniref:Uncharacterized protein n=1 Tax=Sesamum angustifolium TaxID=2727405 RepID=A0AAW2KG33_9LAMI